MIVEEDIKVPMRDGTQLSVRISRPDSGSAPALLAVSPYQHATDGLPHSAMFLWHEVGPVAWYVEHGYAYVHADVRGTGQSEGTFGWLDRDEQTDLYDLIQWIAAQDWCDGGVGGIGQSYYAWSQWFMGVMAPPALRCIAPYDGAVDLYRDSVYHGGVYSEFTTWWFNMLRVNNLHRPAGQPRGPALTRDLAAEIIDHEWYDDFWRERSVFDRIDRIRVPVLSIGHWGKAGLHLRGNVVGFEALGSEKWLLVTRARDVFEAHEQFDRIDFHERVLLPFYERFLKGRDTGYETQTPRVRLEVSNGPDIAAERFPPPQVELRELYLSATPSGAVRSLNDGSLSAVPPQAEGTTEYSYPDREWKFGVVKMGPHGPEPTARVLTFTTQPLDTDVTVAGAASLRLRIATSAPDTDVFVKVSDQGPAGDGARAPSTIVGRGWLRLSHRALDPAQSRPHRPFYRHAAPSPVEAGTIYEVEVEIQPFAHRFPAGHRIRLEIVNGDSVLTDGLFVHQYAWWKVGTDTLHHGGPQPSALRLWVLPEASAEAQPATASQ